MSEEELIRQAQTMIKRFDNMSITGPGWSGDARNGFLFAPPTGACCAGSSVTPPPPECTTRDCTEISTIAFTVALETSGDCSPGYSFSGSHTWTFTRIPHTSSYDAGVDEFKLWIDGTFSPCCTLNIEFHHDSDHGCGGAGHDPLDYQPYCCTESPDGHYPDYNAYPLREFNINYNSDPCTGGTIDILLDGGATDNYPDCGGTQCSTPCQFFAVPISTLPWTFASLSGLIGSYTHSNTCNDMSGHWTSMITVTVVIS